MGDTTAVLEENQTTWRPLGRIFKASGQRNWMISHTAMLVPLHLEGSRYRVYFGTRDASQHPHVGFVEIDLKNPLDILELSSAPVLSPGLVGHFDDNGVYPGPLVPYKDRLLMYYMGRSNGIPPLYTMAIGLAESLDGGRTFQRVLPCPLIDRGPHDPWMVSTPCVLPGEKGGRWQLWYLSGLRWEGEHSFYHIKYAHSLDGRFWQRNGQVAIGLRPDETNVAAPTVIRQNDLYRMWYCFVRRGDSYQLGYAESTDGVWWTRMDERVAFAPQPGFEDWDGRNRAYPAVIQHDGRNYLFYCGNQLGKEGFGVAIEEPA